MSKLLPSINICGRIVGVDYPPLVIVEIGINHGGLLETAYNMVDSAKRAGAEVIKHQTHIVDDEMTLNSWGNIANNAWLLLPNHHHNVDLVLQFLVEAKVAGRFGAKEPLLSFAEELFKSKNISCFRWFV